MSGHPIVALVCSAGGLDALSRVLAPLPADLPAAVVVVQHAAPDAPDVLAGILDRRTALPVGMAQEGDRLTPGRVLVAPPGRHMLVTPGDTVALIPAGDRPPYRPSADLLLTTLATYAGPRVIAVVLSGNGNDAATGATAVHHFGGTVIAASPQTSAAPGMPQATIGRDNATDHVVALDEVGALLLAMTTVPTLGAGDSAPDGAA
ncbi:chemotaxis protein CheB [Actinoplanes sp. URMC 104]|uniref:chemotaxis protein CheB n=1 Tax=Actinoplanes sp. URMC 104 TaxID=3423409 RepID=UPI003F1CE984